MGKKTKTKFKKLDSNIKQHTEPHFNTSTETSNSDINRINQSLDSTRSEEYLSDSLEAVALQDYRNTISLNDSSLVEHESSSRSYSKYKSENSRINNLKSILEPIAGNAEVLELQKAENSAEMLNANAKIFVPKTIPLRSYEFTHRDSGIPLTKQNQFSNDLEVPKNVVKPKRDILGNEVSNAGATTSEWCIIPDSENQSSSNQTSGYSKNQNNSTKPHIDKKEHNELSYASTTKLSSNVAVNDTSDVDKRQNDSEQRPHTSNKYVNKSFEDYNRSSDGKCLSNQGMFNSFPQQRKKKYSDPRFERGRQSRNFTYSSDEEYQQFLSYKGFTKTIEEKDQDLFAMPKDYALAHCVAEDMRMGSGIAVQFKKDFKRVDELLQQNAKEGSLAILNITTDNNDNRYIYYLVTKKLSNGKPTYFNFWSSVKEMRNHIRDNYVKKLAMPKIGCGLDRLEWFKVKQMIEFLFKDVDVDIVVCNFQQSEDTPSKDYNTCRIVHKEMAVADIEPYTIIIYLSTEDGHFSDDMNQLAEKFNFKNRFQMDRKRLGDCIKFKQPTYSLYGCIVRKTAKSEFNYPSFKKCLLEINRDNQKDLFDYVAIQAIEDENDPIINEKLVTIMRGYLREVEIYFCWNGELSDQMSIRRQDQRASLTAFDKQHSSNQTSDLSKTQNNNDLERPPIDVGVHNEMNFASTANSTANDQGWNDISWDQEGDDQSICKYRGDDSASNGPNISGKGNCNRSSDRRKSSNQGMNNSISQPSKRNSDSPVDSDMQSRTSISNAEEEYQQFLSYKQNKNEKFIKVIEKNQDLFTMPKDYALAHCVAEDMNMGSGIAVHFRRDFKRVDELLQQKAKQGGLAILDDNDRFIYYLVTKRISTGKPTYETFWSSVRKMRNHIRDHNVKKLAMPRIGCGLDGLEWSRVKLKIEFLFKDLDIEIVICNFQQNYGKTKQKLQVTKVKSKKDKKKNKKKK